MLAPGAFNRPEEAYLCELNKLLGNFPVNHAILFKPYKLAMDLSVFRARSKADFARMKAFLGQLRRKKPADLDRRFHELHEDVFSSIDCLSCANCCKTTGPLFISSDIERIATHLRIKPGSFIDKFLRIDEDGDYVLKELPCPFLGADNYCSIYDLRPRACREYPHTNRKKMYQIMDLTARNTQVCPAAYHIVKRLESEVYRRQG